MVETPFLARTQGRNFGDTPRLSVGRLSRVPTHTVYGGPWANPSLSDGRAHAWTRTRLGVSLGRKVLDYNSGQRKIRAARRSTDHAPPAMRSAKTAWAGNVRAVEKEAPSRGLAGSGPENRFFVEVSLQCYVQTRSPRKTRRRLGGLHSGSWQVLAAGTQAARS